MTLFDALLCYNTLIEDPITGNYSYNYERAFQLFNQLNEAEDGGDGDVQYYLYECYKYGRGVSKNTKRAREYLELSLNQECSKALCELSMISAQLYHTSVFKNDEEQIEILASILETFEMATKKSVKAKYEMAYFLFNIVLAMSDQSTPQYKDTFEQIVDLLNAASSAGDPDAIFMMGDLIKKSRTPNTELYVSNAQEAYPPFYLKAAGYGCMHALAPICEMYLETKDYAKMTWWYWWARKYDNQYKNDKICKIIKSDAVLSVINAYMMTGHYTLNKNSTDNRLYKEVTKMWFLNAYHDGIRLVDLVPYYDYDKLGEIKVDQSKSTEYTTIVAHINATKAGQDVERLNQMKIFTMD